MPNKVQSACGGEKCPGSLGCLGQNFDKGERGAVVFLWKSAVDQPSNGGWLRDLWQFIEALTSLPGRWRIWQRD